MFHPNNSEWQGVELPIEWRGVKLLIEWRGVKLVMQSVALMIFRVASMGGIGQQRSTWFG